MATVDVDIKKTIEEGFLVYAGHVIQARSIPDARDCLKYSARQLLYSQFHDKITYDKPFKKAQKSVASAMALCYVHGDASAYGTLVRMAKPFALRYPLEEGQGNVGTPIDPQDHAASRYLELRTAPISQELFNALTKNTIDDWRDNYDQTEKFPMVLPSLGYYNIVNGCSGIAVGMSTSIPQFNLVEVNEALIKLLWNESATFEELYCPIDFATGGTIINESEARESLRNGNGKAAKIRAKIEYEPVKHQLIVTEMPYSVYTNTVCKELGAFMDESTAYGIDKFIDASNTVPCIKISLTKTANPERVKDWLYKNTSLQSFYSINMIMLENGRVPKLYGWKEALCSHLAHEKEVLRKEYEYDLAKAKNRLHIVEGLLIALANIDEVVKTVKESNSTLLATNALMSKFNLSELQAKAILDLKLQRLVHLEVTKLENEKLELLNTIADIEKILNTQELFYKEIEKKLRAVSKKYGDARRTKNMDLIQDDGTIRPIEEKKLLVHFTNNGCILAVDANTIATQNRGGKGKQIKLDNDYIVNTIYAENTENVMILTNNGKAYTLTLAVLPVNEEVYIQSLLEFEPNEKINFVIPYSDIDKYKYVAMATEDGSIKKTEIEEYKSKRKQGIIGLKLRDGDKVISVMLLKGDEDFFVATKKGYCLRFTSTDVSATGRASLGVKSIKLSEGDIVVGADVYSSSKNYKGLMSISAKGTGKIVGTDEWALGTRATKGVLVQKFNDDDSLATIALIPNAAKELIIGTNSSMIKIPIASIPIFSNAAKGVSITKTKPGQSILQILQVKE